MASACFVALFFVVSGFCLCSVIINMVSACIIALPVPLLFMILSLGSLLLMAVSPVL
jgi:hypothetical protein